jgi:predicted nucleic acid-binding protein
MKKVLLDTDVLLDKILGRDPWLSEATTFWEAIRARQVQAFACAITPLNIGYIAGRLVGTPKVRTIVSDLLEVVRIIPVDEGILRLALTSPIDDYEDAVQHSSALSAGVDSIVTRNIEDYRNATLPVLAPPDFMKQLSAL